MDKNLTKDSCKHEHDIVLHAAHDEKLSGYKTTVPCDTKKLVVPDACGCTSTFAPAGYSYEGDDGVVREVWRQVDFKFREFRN